MPETEKSFLQVLFEANGFQVARSLSTLTVSSALRSGGRLQEEGCLTNEPDAIPSSWRIRPGKCSTFQVCFKPIPLPIEIAHPSLGYTVLKLVNESRSTYGLRHQDFARYQ